MKMRSSQLRAGCRRPLARGLRTALPVALAATFHSVFAAGAGAQSCMEWVLRSMEGPAPRWSTSMAYDEHRGVAVLFGGGSLPGHGDTWEWNGTTWTFVAESGPAPRASHAMAYDSAARRHIIFGGVDRSEIFGDTWAWNGVEWTQIANEGPWRRHNHAMAYDSVRDVMVLFGGFALQTPETWELSGSTWTRVAQTGPRARWDHAMAFDSFRGVTVLFGGWASNNQRFNDTWTWDGAVWTQVATEGPSPRAEPKMTYDSNRRVIVLHGGDDTEPGYLDDTWDWDGTRWTQIATGGPPRRISPDMAYDSRRQAVILFGGSSDSGSTFLGDTWEYRRQPQLTIGASCPDGGPIRIEWSCTTPNGVIALLFARSAGNVNIPNGRPCAGTRLGLGPQSLQLVHTARSDAMGAGVLNASAPRTACGGLLQALDLSTCALSEVQAVK